MRDGTDRSLRVKCPLQEEYVTENGREQIGGSSSFLFFLWFLF